MTTQIGSAVLYVVDLTAMTKFYADVLGLSPTAGEHADVWQEFDVGAFRLGLHQIPQEILKNLRPPAVVAPRERNPIKLVFSVPDVDKERKRLENLNVMLLVRPWGGCDVVDPEGNIFGLTQASLHVDD